MSLRLKPEARSKQILDVALKLAEKSNYSTVTRDAIASAAGVSMGLVTNYFGTMAQFRRTLMRAAIHRGNARIVAQGLANKDPQARKAPDELKAKAVEFLLS